MSLLQNMGILLHSIQLWLLQKQLILPGSLTSLETRGTGGHCLAGTLRCYWKCGWSSDEQRPGNQYQQNSPNQPSALCEICHPKTEICLTSNLSKDLTAPLKRPNCVSQVSDYASTQLVPKYLNNLWFISAEHIEVAGVFLLPAFSCCDIMLPNVTPLPVSFQM